MRPHTRRDKEKYRDKLRRNPTRAEAQLWPYLRKAFGRRAENQAIVRGFIIDFKVDDLLIEIDGSIHDQVFNKYADEQRTEILLGYGYTMMRFRNEEVYADPKAVVREINTELKYPGFWRRLLGR